MRLCGFKDTLRVFQVATTAFTCTRTRILLINAWLLGHTSIPITWVNSIHDLSKCTRWESKAIFGLRKKALRNGQKYNSFDIRFIKLLHSKCAHFAILSLEKESFVIFSRLWKVLLMRILLSECPRQPKIRPKTRGRLGKHWGWQRRQRHLWF